MSRFASVASFAFALTLSAPAWAIIFVGNPSPDGNLIPVSPTLDQIELGWSFSAPVSLDAAVADIHQLVLFGCDGTPQQGQVWHQPVNTTADLALDWDVSLAPGAWCTVEMELSAPITLEGVGTQGTPFSIGVDPGVIEIGAAGGLAEDLRWTAIAL